MMDQKYDDKSATDKTGEKDAKEQVLPDDWDMKNEEISKKEPASAVIITDATGMKTEIQEGVRDDTAKVDKNETDEALFNRENAPEVRTESQRKPNNRHSKNWRLRELMMMLMLLLLLMLVFLLVLYRGRPSRCFYQRQDMAGPVEPAFV